MFKIIIKNQALRIVFVLIIFIGGYFVYKIYQINSLQTVKAEKGTIIASIYQSGVIKAEKEADLSFTSTGKIIYLPFKKNQEVKKDQIVASIDTSDTQANKDKEMRDFLKARLDLDQIQKDTYKDQVETDTIKRAKEKVQLDLEKSVYDVEIANRALNNSSLYSPFDGIVTAVNGEINEWTSIFSTNPLIVITNPKTVYFEAEIDEENIGKIKVGQKSIITLDAYPKTQFNGVVAEIDKKTIIKENGDTVLPVKIIFTSGDDLPLVGLNGDVQFILEKKEDVLVLPKRLIKKKSGSVTVTVKNGFALKTVPVETGVSDAKNIEIIKGITGEDKIVLSSELE